MEDTKQIDKGFSEPNPCKHRLRENSFKSIYCLKLGQWVSAKYCSVCCFYAERDNYDITQKPLLDNYSYNYNITQKFKRTKTKLNKTNQKLTFSCSMLSGGSR